MGKLDFSISSSLSVEKLFDYIIDFEYYKNFFPKQINQITITHRSSDEIHTSEELVFSSIIKNTIQQKSIHKLLPNEKIITEIIEGPAKGTMVNIFFLKNNSDTEINFNVDLKLSFKAKFLEPLIKKLYKRYLTSLIYKINNRDARGEI